MLEAAVPGYLHPFPVPTPFPVGPVNLYLAEGDPLTLIDTGPRYEPARDALHKQLNAIGYRADDLRRILLTHAHADHCGLAAELADASGAEIWTHAENLHRLSRDATARRAAFYARMTRWAGVPLKTVLKLTSMRRGLRQYSEPLTPERTLADGDVIDLGGEPWHVLHTPGHTGGLICLHHAERHLLISSDHLLRDISSNPVVDPPASGSHERPRRLVEYLGQLRRVAQLDLALVLPGHGPPITDHRALIQKRLDFHEKRAQRILERLDGQPHTPHQIAKTLFPELDPINTFLAISEVIGHLEWLETRGDVTYTERGGVAHWVRAA